PDYSGPDDEVMIQVLNFTGSAIEVRQGDRLAQGLVLPATRVEWQEVDAIRPVARGGFGATGGDASCTSTWTPSTRPWNSATIPTCAASPWPSAAIHTGAASSRRPATKRVSMACAPRSRWLARSDSVRRS